jgi:hypothetical protein
MEKKVKMKRVTESEIRMLDIIRAYGIHPEVIVREVSHLAEAARKDRKAGKKNG